MTKRMTWHYGPNFSGTHPWTLAKMFYNFLVSSGAANLKAFEAGNYPDCDFEPDEYMPNWHEAMQIVKRRLTRESGQLLCMFCRKPAGADSIMDDNGAVACQECGTAEIAAQNIERRALSATPL